MVSLTHFQGKAFAFPEVIWSKFVTPANAHKLLLAVEGQISLKTAAAAVRWLQVPGRGFLFPAGSWGLPAGERVSSLAVRSLAVKQLWSRSPLSDTYVLDKNPLNSSGSPQWLLHCWAPNLQGFFSQWDCNGLRSVGRSRGCTGFMWERKVCWGGQKITCCSIFEHGDSFIES